MEINVDLVFGNTSSPTPLTFLYAVVQIDRSTVVGHNLPCGIKVKRYVAQILCVRRSRHDIHFVAARLRNYSGIAAGDGIRPGRVLAGVQENVRMATNNHVNVFATELGNDFVIWVAGVGENDYYIHILFAFQHTCFRLHRLRLVVEDQLAQIAQVGDGLLVGWIKKRLKNGSLIRNGKKVLKSLFPETHICRLENNADYSNLTAVLFDDQGLLERANEVELLRRINIADENRAGRVLDVGQHTI